LWEHLLDRQSPNKRPAETTAPAPAPEGGCKKPKFRLLRRHSTLSSVGSVENAGASAETSGSISLEATSGSKTQTGFAGSSCVRTPTGLSPTHSARKGSVSPDRSPIGLPPTGSAQNGSVSPGRTPTGLSPKGDDQDSNGLSCTGLLVSPKRDDDQGSHASSESAFWRDLVSPKKDDDQASHASSESAFWRDLGSPKKDFLNEEAKAAADGVTAASSGAGVEAAADGVTTAATAADGVTAAADGVTTAAAAADGVTAAADGVTTAAAAADGVTAAADGASTEEPAPPAVVAVRRAAVAVGMFSFHDSFDFRSKASGRPAKVVVKDLLQELAVLRTPWPTWLGVSCNEMLAEMSLDALAIALRALVAVAHPDFVVKVEKRMEKDRYKLIFSIRATSKEQFTQMVIHAALGTHFDVSDAFSLALCWRSVLLVLSTSESIPPEDRKDFCTSCKAMIEETVTRAPSP
jgi:hypothetical protein